MLTLSKVFSFPLVHLLTTYETYLKIDCKVATSLQPDGV
jgi:hypothetical protein